VAGGGVSVFQLRRPQLILSLCDRTGNWSGPYEEDGYEVVRVDLEHGQDVRLLELPKQAGARHPRRSALHRVRQLGRSVAEDATTRCARA
jgi:hypothetical protein